MEEKQYCRNRLTVAYNPDAPTPEKWLDFLRQLLEEEDIPTLQEYLGYCLLPVTKAQKMMMIIGRGGEGKSRIGIVMNTLLGKAMNTTSIQKVENDKFARADQGNKLLMVDDDMDMNALKKTNYIKSIVTSEGKMDVEKKHAQSFQDQLYVRFLCFGNGVLTALHDRSDGFFRRQIILTTKDKPADRVDDPYLVEKLVQEKEDMDEKTPHMHLSFVPLTEDGRLSAKDIVGNKKKLTQWQDEFWEHMVEKYPDLERGQSASETGRNHIPPRLFKQMTHLTKQKERIDALISDANFFNSKGKIDEVAKMLDKYIPAVAKMDTELKKYRVGYAQLERKNKSLEKQNERLTEQLEEEQHESILKKMEDMRLRRDYDAAVALLDRIPKEVLDVYSGKADRQNRRKQAHEL